MTIIFDYDNPPGSIMEGRHFVETHPGGQPQVSHPKLGPVPVDVIHYIKAIHVGDISQIDTGWDVVTKHPLYPGKTRFEALIAEIVRLNDVPSREVLGI